MAGLVYDLRPTTYMPKQDTGALAYSTPLSSSWIRFLMTSSAMSGTTSQAISRTIRSESFSTTREARRSRSRFGKVAIRARD